MPTDAGKICQTASAYCALRSYFSTFFMCSLIFFGSFTMTESLHSPMSLTRNTPIPDEELYTQGFVRAVKGLIIFFGQENVSHLFLSN